IVGKTPTSVFWHVGSGLSTPECDVWAIGLSMVRALDPDGDLNDLPNLRRATPVSLCFDSASERNGGRLPKRSTGTPRAIMNVGCTLTRAAPSEREEIQIDASPVMFPARMWIANGSRRMIVQERLSLEFDE